MGSSWVGRHRNALLLALLLGAYTVQSFAISAQTGGLISNVVLTAMELAMCFIVFLPSGRSYPNTNYVNCRF